MGFAFISGDPTTADDSVPRAKPGAFYYTSDGRLWIYVKVVGTAGSTIAGRPLCWATAADGFSVSMITASIITPGQVLARATCVAQGVITTGQYGYGLVRGKGTYIGDGSVAAGDFIVVDGGTSPTSNFDTAAAGDEHGVIGQALDNDSGSPAAGTAEFWIA